MWIIRKLNPWASEPERFYPMGCPAVKLIKDFELAVAVKKQLELLSLKNYYVSYNYEYWDVNCSKELMRLDDYLRANHGFGVLVEGYPKEELIPSNYIINDYFPNIADEKILEIQQFIGKFHYGIQEVTEPGKYVVLFSKGGGFQDESIAGTHKFDYFDSELEAKESIINLRSFYHFFDVWGSGDIIGQINDDRLTSKTKSILENQHYINYLSHQEHLGGRFLSDSKLDDIPNGRMLLFDILYSLYPKPFDIVVC